MTKEESRRETSAKGRPQSRNKVGTKQNQEQEHSRNKTRNQELNTGKEQKQNQKSKQSRNKTRNQKPEQRTGTKNQNIKE